MILRYCLISLLAASLFAKTPSTHHSSTSESSQAQPAPERIAEIQAALKAHGYEPGDTWEETREVCRKIADEHMWQTDHAPDARVLILLGLGGPHSDPAVTQMQGDRLDNDQRIDAAHKSESAEAYAAAPVPLCTVCPIACSTGEALQRFGGEFKDDCNVVNPSRQSQSERENTGQETREKGHACQVKECAQEEIEHQEYESK